MKPICDPSTTTNNDSENHHHNFAKWLAIATAVTAGAIIVAPYVLPLAGIGEGEDIVNIMTAIHNNPSVPGTGLAGFINKGLGAVPLIGETLAKGSIATALISGGVGIGGVLLGRYIGKRENGKHYVKWGNVISTAALLTSAIIALPTALTSITAGITFLASLAGPEMSGAALTMLRSTVGVANSEGLTSGGLSAASLAVPHLLTCGTGALPALVSFGLHHTTKKNADCDLPANSEALADKGKIIAQINVDKPTCAFEPSKGTLTLTHADTGQPVTLDEIKVTHTKKIHVLIVDSSLKDYHHIHPVPTDTPGQYSFAFTPKTSNRYQGWSDFTLNNGDNRHLAADIPSLMRRNIPAHVTPNSRAVAENSNLSLEWSSDKPLEQGKTSTVTVRVRDDNGNPVTNLEPVLGAFAHLVGFSEDGNHIVHCHPLGNVPTSDAARSGPELNFHITPKSAGSIQFFLQIQREGKDIVVPFGQQVLPPEKASTQQEKPSWTANTSMPAHTGHAFGV